MCARTENRSRPSGLCAKPAPTTPTRSLRCCAMQDDVPVDTRVVCRRSVELDLVIFGEQVLHIGPRRVGHGLHLLDVILELFARQKLIALQSRLRLALELRILLYGVETLLQGIACFGGRLAMQEQDL